MYIFAQGIMGLTDMFIHPGYLSSVSQTDLGPTGPALMAFIISTLLFGSALIIYIHFRDKRRKREKNDNEITKKGPP